MQPTRAQDGLHQLCSALLLAADRDVLVWSEPDAHPLHTVHIERGELYVRISSRRGPSA